ncbi:universal stress protein [Alcaligenaceae bacterium]|nr:universal stress protein [Alcaligenaceae bacterium]
MNTILFATDLSSESELAQQRARQLSAFFNAKLRTVHVPERTNKPRQATPATANSAAPDDRCMPMETMPGDACEIITRLAQDVDLLVLGQPRRRTAGELFTGTTGERIIRQVKAPVLVVKTPAAGVYRRILVAVDVLHRPADILRMAKAIADVSTHCEVVYAYDSPELNMMVQASTYTMANVSQHMADQHSELNKQLRAEMTKTGLRGRTSPVQIETSPAATLIALAERLDADLIILGSRRPGLKRLVLGSVATQVLSRAQMDVLIVPPTDGD